MMCSVNLDAVAQMMGNSATTKHADRMLKMMASDRVQCKTLEDLGRMNDALFFRYVDLAIF